MIDPLNSSNNITRTAFRIADIQEVFKKGYEFLNMHMNRYREGEEGGKLEEVI